MDYWQIACGSDQRDYADAFIRFGMAFVGGDKQIATMAYVKAGDRVLMKRGMSKIVAAGEVVKREGKHRGVKDKDWPRDFDGWDLPAYCFVDWHRPNKPIRAKGLTRSTIQNVHQQQLKDLADQIIATVPAQQKLEPGPTDEVKDDAILAFLIRQGLRPGAAENLTATFNRIRLLAKYYYDYCEWEDIREHETRSFLIVPLLLALGWSEQQIKIELPVVQRQRADIACFSKPYTSNNKDCVAIIESKGFSQGLKYAPNQVRAYAVHFPKCKVVVASNGYCYKAFRRASGGKFSQTPSAYLNLLSPRDKYPLDPENVEGCLEALRLLLPSTWT